MCRLIWGFVLTFLVDVSAIELYQWPRFVGVKSGRSVTLHCRNRARTAMSGVTWLRARVAGDTPQVIGESHSVKHGQYTGRITLSSLQAEDEGVYYCHVKGTLGHHVNGTLGHHVNGTLGPGTQLQVVMPRDVKAAVQRSRMKDAIIFIQGLLLGLFVSIPHLCSKEKPEKEEPVYEDPNDDHTYEGLNIENYDIYEDIPALSLIEEDEPCGMESPSPNNEISLEESQE